MKAVLLLLLFVATSAYSQTFVNQGKPGTQGPWPVKTVGSVIVVGPDGGVVGGGATITGPVVVIGPDGGVVNVNGSIVALGPDGGVVNVNGSIVALGPDGGAVNVNVVNQLVVVGSDGGSVSNVTVLNTLNVVGPDGGAVVSGYASVTTANNDGACPGGAANFTVISAFAGRRSLFIWADPSNHKDVFVKLGTTATSGDARLAPGQALNIDSSVIYTGQVDAFPESGTQKVCVVEL